MEGRGCTRSGERQKGPTGLHFLMSEVTLNTLCLPLSSEGDATPSGSATLVGPFRPGDRQRAHLPQPLHPALHPKSLKQSARLARAATTSHQKGTIYPCFEKDDLPCRVKSERGKLFTSGGWWNADTMPPRTQHSPALLLLYYSHA